MPRTKLETWYLVKLKTLLEEYLAGNLSFPHFVTSVWKMKPEFEERLLGTLEEEQSSPDTEAKSGRLLTFPEQEA